MFPQKHIRIFWKTRTCFFNPFVMDFDIACGKIRDVYVSLYRKQKNKRIYDYIRPTTQRVGARASAEGVSLTSMAKPSS